MYYSLLDMTARYDIKTVVISVEYLQVMEQAMSPEAELLVIDEMKDPRSITEDIRDTFTVEQLPFLLKSFRYRTNMHAAGKIAGEKDRAVFGPGQ
jgi:hypothetical protein